MPRGAKTAAPDARPAKTVFEAKVPMPNPGRRGSRVAARQVHVSVFPDLLAMNHHVWAKRLFPRGRLVVGFARCRRSGPVAAYLYFSRDMLLPGIVAHECAHAALFIAKNDLGWKSVYGRAWRRRSGPKRGFRLGSEKEEWFCRALDHLVEQVLDGAEGAGGGSAVAAAGAQAEVRGGT